MKKTEKEKFKAKFSTCSGPSMYPTLKNGDGIQLEEYGCCEDVRIGDIIVYPSPVKNFDIVHRVIKIKADGFITRGDNNNKVDPYLIEFNKIKGKVIIARRRDKAFKAINGCAGYYVHRLMLFRKIAAPFILRPPQYISALIDRSRLLNFMHPLFKLEKVAVNKKNKKEIMLIYKKKVIGRKINNNEWLVRFPYKYFINKEKIK